MSRHTFNHLAKLPTITAAYDDATDKAARRNDERILTLIRKQLAQFNLRNHVVKVSAGVIYIEGRTTTYTVSLDWCPPLWLERPSFMEIVEGVLVATEALKQYDNDVARVA